MRLHRAPEVRTLISIDVLGGPDIYSTLSVGSRRIKDWRIEGIRGHRVSIRQNVRRVVGALGPIAIRDHNLDGNDVCRDCCSGVGGGSGTHHVVGVNSPAVGE